MNTIIVGGGVAGMMAAISAAENTTNKVIIIEKNDKLGKKLFISGKGRCNLTNATEPQLFIKNVASNAKFLLSALYAFSPNDTIEYFKTLGLPLKIERGNRVFPETDKSSDVISVLLKKIKSLNIEICLSQTVRYFNVKNDIITAVVTDKQEYSASHVIICTGGASYPGTGSTGDGYKFAKMLGHSVVDVRAALCPINLKGCLDYSGKLSTDIPFPQGLSLKNVSIKCIDTRNKVIAQDFGEMLFTRKGVSGPIILSISSLINKKDLSNLSLVLDLKPALDFNTLEARIIRDFKDNNNKQFKNSLNQLLPKSLIPYIISLSGIEPDTMVHSITKMQRANLTKLLKSLTFPIDSLASLAEAIVTAGGVSVKEIDPRTMKSRIIKNLYFAGEVIDVDALTGGYNIQIALSTGYMAGKLQS